jgi:hypothetical protein
MLMQLQVKDAELHLGYGAQAVPLNAVDFIVLTSNSKGELHQWSIGFMVNIISLSLSTDT